MIPRELSEASARPHKCRNNLLIRESRSEQIFKQTVKTSVGRCPKVVCDGFSQTLPRRWSSFSFFFFSFCARSIVRKRQGGHYEPEAPSWQKLSSSHRRREQYLVTASEGESSFSKEATNPEKPFRGRNVRNPATRAEKESRGPKRKLSAFEARGSSRHELCACTGNTSRPKLSFRGRKYRLRLVHPSLTFVSATTHAGPPMCAAMDAIPAPEFLWQPN